MSTSSGAPSRSPGTPEELRLHWEIPPALPEFASNLKALFEVPQLAYFPAGDFWPDVFVRRPLPFKNLARSYSYHALVLALIWLISLPFYERRFFVELTYPKPGERLTYYADLAPYIPQVTARSAPAPRAMKAAPRKAAIKVESVPVHYDNRSQTVVAPAAPQIITHELQLPNVITVAPAPAPPVAALTEKPKLTYTPLEPIAPAPTLKQQASVRLPQLPQTAPVQPAANAGQRAIARLQLPDLRAEAVNAAPKLPVSGTQKLSTLPIGEAVGPAPDATRLSRSSMAALAGGPAAPQVVAPAPSAAALRGASAAFGLPGPAQPVAPAPSVQALGGSAKNPAGTLIALGLNPAPAAPPKAEGSRRGMFGMSPEGTPEAAGTPEIHAGGAGPGGDAPANTPASELGLKITPTQPTNGGAPGTNSSAANPAKPFQLPSTRETLLAKAAPPEPSVPTRSNEVRAAQPPTDKVDEQVFGSRKYYTMALNTPNLTSASGSWIFRFAELSGHAVQGELTAPVAVQKVDPAYPADLMRDRVEGTVICYAVIRSDGTVGDVRVLEGFDSTLDENAKRALSRWHFRPGTKNGTPVDLEAVVRIPFKASRRVPGF